MPRRDHCEEGIVDGAELDVPGEAVVNGELRVPDEADPTPRKAHCDEGVVDGAELTRGVAVVNDELWYLVLPIRRPGRRIAEKA